MLTVIGAGEQQRVREFVAHQLDDPGRGGPVIDADEDQRRVMRPGGVQDVEPLAVAEIDLEAEGGRDADHLGIIVDGGDGIAARQQRLADDLAEAAEADQQRGAGRVLRRLDAAGIDLDLRHQPVMDQHEQRRQQHRDDDDGGQHGAAFVADQADREGGGVEDEGKLAALRHQYGALGRFAVTGLEQARDAVDTSRLEQREGDDADGDQLPVVRDHVEVQRHADREEEEAEQDAPEGFDIRFQFVAVGGFRQQHAGEEGAHRGR